MADIAKMIEEIKGMTVLELNDLVKAIETEFGVSAAAMASKKSMAKYHTLNLFMIVKKLIT